MKILFDMFPVLLFFAAYTVTDSMYIATGIAMVATVGQVIYVKIRHGKVDNMLWVSLVLIMVMGGLTIMLQDKRFIMWKPTALYWIFALVLAISAQFFNKNLIRAMMGTQIELPDVAWTKLNWSWVIFFLIMGVINLYVAFSYSEAIWVKFKLFGGIGLMLVFVLLQGVMLSKYMQDGEPK